MTKIGEQKYGKDIGKCPTNNAFIWQACLDCGKERWVRIRKDRPIILRCHSCNGKLRGEKHSTWKGGRSISSQGYIQIKLLPGDFFYSMAQKSGYVYEHRLIVAKALERCLHSWEIVHHKEGYAKDDNQYPETLQLVTDDRHKQITILENRIRQLEQRVLLLESENILLKVGVSQ